LHQLHLLTEMDSSTPEPEPIDELQRSLGYAFVVAELLRQAVTHRSYSVEHGPGTPDNERLEFLGDAVLELVVSHLLFDRYGSEYREGDLTRMRAFLVNEGQLAKQARSIGLGRYLRLGKGEARSGGGEKDSILSDCLEAVVGAIYLDGGLGPALGFVERCFKDLLNDLAGVGLGQDYKSSLQELMQSKYHDTPVYAVEDVSGPDHERTFSVALHFHGEMLARGSGRSKKEAEQEAAREALAVLVA
jgi:ribonuclease III